MAKLSPRNLSQLRQQNPKLGECLTDIVDAHNNVAQQTNAEPVGTTVPPPSHAALTVTGGAGFFSAQIAAPNAAYRGQQHFLEVSEDKNFGAGAVHKIHLGASTSYYGNLGAKTLHFRSYSSYPTSGPSAPVYAMNVDGSGSTAPAIAGSATADGFGAARYLNSDVTPKR